MELFKGNESAYGVHIPEDAPEGKKAKGKSFSEQKPLDSKQYIAHLHGKRGLGLVPVNQEGMVKFAVIDVDIYPLDPVELLMAVTRSKLPLVGFRSKSGGLHLYCFFSKPESASGAIKELRRIVHMFGLKPATEVFPKQTTLDENGTGNWINLPYFNAKDTKRYAYNLDGSPMLLEQALTICTNMKVTLKDLKARIDEAPLAQAPVCLQTIYMLGGAQEGERNGFLFNCAVYLKSRFGEEFPVQVHNLNEHLIDPLPYAEVDTTVIASHIKQDYSYRCSDGILANYCNKELCALRKFGKTAKEVSSFEFGQLTQIRTGRSASKYKWYINANLLEFASADELANQNVFRRLCMDNLREVPNKLTEKAWLGIVRRAFTQMDVIDEDLGDDQDNALWLMHAEKFFARRFGVRPEQMEEGYVWFNERTKEMGFSLTHFVQFMVDSRMFEQYPKNDHSSLLRKLGSKRKNFKYRMNGPSTVKRWCLGLKELHEKGRFLSVSMNSGDTVEELPSNIEKLIPKIQEKY